MELGVLLAAVLIDANALDGRRGHRAAARHRETKEAHSDRGGRVGGSLANGAGFRDTFGQLGGFGGGSGGGGGSSG
ncbi:MAG TPA: hypothetical protein VNL94_09735 [Candidatus Binatia bacterium]|nr:hypothetical protein [Candidatus Binatia bacterium]